MIRSFEIENFKVFRHAKIEVRQLNLLTGVNSSGKSSFLQALRLAELAATHGPAVQLNGLLGLELGEASDILNHEAVEQRVELTIRTDERTDHFTLAVPVDRTVVLERSASNSASGERDWRIGTYLGAERSGPRDLSNVPPTGNVNVDVGVSGEFTAHALAHFGRNRIRESLLHPSTASEALTSGLRDQAEAWLSSIVRPTKIQSTWIDRTSAATLRFRDHRVKADWVRPANVGFGLTYVLPIIVAGLGSDPDAAFVTESPEAHLHPRAQSEIGKFLVRLAGSGVQTFVETHSDHVLNGVRIAVAAEQLLDPDDVAIHFFGPPGSEVTAIDLNSTGSLSEWPRGFFDQAMEDLSVVSRLGARG